MGHSSGAHSVAMLTTEKRFLENTGVIVSALIAVAGPYDLPLDNPEVRPVFAGFSASSVTPVLMVTASHPRTLLLRGLSDKRVDPRHSRRFKEALESKRVPVTMHLLEGATHAGILAGVALPLRFTNDTLKYVLDFLSAPDAK